MLDWCEIQRHSKALDSFPERHLINLLKDTNDTNFWKTIQPSPQRHLIHVLSCESSHLNFLSSKSSWVWTTCILLLQGMRVMSVSCHQSHLGFHSRWSKVISFPMIKVVLFSVLLLFIHVSFPMIKVISFMSLFSVHLLLWSTSVPLTLLHTALQNLEQRQVSFGPRPACRFWRFRLFYPKNLNPKP